MYRFVGNQPPTAIDPMGLDWVPPYTPPKGSPIAYPWPYSIEHKVFDPFTGAPVPPVFFPGPEEWPHTYPHSEENKRCIFILAGFKPGDFGEGAVDTNGGPVILNVIDPNVIPNTIESSGCCEILILGHQGAPEHVGGGTAESPTKGKVPILPSSDGKIEEKIRKALTGNGCSGCSLFFYTCGGGDQERQRRVREGIADDIGCDVFGPQHVPIPIDPAGRDYCRIGSKNTGAGCMHPYPFYKYPTKSPIKPTDY